MEIGEKTEAILSWSVHTDSWRQKKNIVPPSLFLLLLFALCQLLNLTFAFEFFEGAS